MQHVSSTVKGPMSRHASVLLAFAMVLAAACSSDLPTTTNPASSPLGTASLVLPPSQGPCGPLSQATFVTPDGRSLGLFSTYWDDYNVYGEFHSLVPGVSIRRTSLGIYEQQAEIPIAPDGTVLFERLNLQSHNVPPVARLRQWRVMDDVNDMLGVYRALPRAVLQEPDGGRQALWAGGRILWEGDSIARQLVVNMRSTCAPRVTVLADLSMLVNGGLPGNTSFADLLLWMREQPRSKGSASLPRHWGAQPTFGVMLDRGRASPCWLDGSCTDTALTGLRTLYTGTGATVSDIFSSPGSLLSFPPDVGLLLLVLPRQDYTVDEINALKQFVAEGGRIVLVTEESGYYDETGRETMNRFLADMGSEARVRRGALDCGGYQDLPLTGWPLHRLTAWSESARVNCTGALITGFLDFKLFRDASGREVTGASITVSTTPIAAHAQSVGEVSTNPEP